MRRRRSFLLAALALCLLPATTLACGGGFGGGSAGGGILLVLLLVLGLPFLVSELALLAAPVVLLWVAFVYLRRARSESPAEGGVPEGWVAKPVNPDSGAEEVPGFSWRVATGQAVGAAVTFLGTAIVLIGVVLR